MKGVSEDLPAILFVMILLVAFLISILHAYGIFFGSTNLIQEKRIASSIAENISTKVVVSEPQAVADSFNGKKGIYVKIYNLDVPGLSPLTTEKDFSKSDAVASAAILIEKAGILYAGRVDVHVGK